MIVILRLKMEAKNIATELRNTMDETEQENRQLKNKGKGMLLTERLNQLKEKTQKMEDDTFSKFELALTEMFNRGVETAAYAITEKWHSGNLVDAERAVEEIMKCLIHKP